jgi:DNA end-binding protein Ku
MKASAAAPSRSTSTAVISFGLVAIPVSLYTATETTRVARKEFTADGHEVGRQQFDKETGETLASDQIIKRAQATDGTWVDLTDDEVAQATTPFDSAQVETTVPTAIVLSEYVTEKLYQIRPKTEKKGTAAIERSFALFMKALALRDEAAIVRIPMRNNVPRIGAITGDGYLRILTFTDAVRSERPMPDVDLSDDELALANQLIDVIGGTDMPDTTDTTAAAIQTYVDAKANGATPAPAKVAAPATADTDLAALLKKSLAS